MAAVNKVETIGAAAHEPVPPTPEASVQDAKKAERINRFLDEFGAPERRATAMRKAFETCMALEEFVGEFLPAEQMNHASGRYFAGRVKAVIG